MCFMKEGLQIAFRVTLLSALGVEAIIEVAELLLNGRICWKDGDIPPIRIRGARFFASEQARLCQSHLLSLGRLFS